jgi:hypothetical protein
MPTYLRKTSNYTANVGDYIIADTSTGSFTITLPASPTTGDFVQIVDGANWETYNLLVDRNGSTIEGNADNVLLDLAGVKAEFVYDSTTWELFISDIAVEPEGTKYTSKKLRFNNAEQFKEGFSETNASVGYVYLGRHLVWDSPSAPDVLTDTVAAEKSIWNNMIAAKKVTGNDVEFVIPKNTWAANNKYIQFDDTLTLDTLLTSNSRQNLYSCYVYNSERNVYKCLSNNLSSNSTVEPLGTNLGNRGIIETGDGYLWKYMYNVQAANKFLANVWLPAPASIDQLEYNGSANATIDGEITTIVVQTAGSGYYNTNANVSSFNTSCSVLTVEAAVDMANLIVTNMAVTGNGILANTYITAVDLVNRKINLSYATASAGGGTSNTLSFKTRVVVDGDGSGAVATANIGGNTQISNITLTSYGRGYTYANVNIYGTATGLNVASARAIIGPKYGHGYNPAKELGGHNVMIALKIGEGDTTEGNVISANTSFRQYGLLRNPHKYGANTPVTYANSNTVISQTTSLTLIAGSDYQVNEFVYQGSFSSPTFSGYVESFTSTTVNLTNVRGTIALGSVLKGTVTNPTGRTVSEINYPEFEKYTGDVLYNENIVAVQRTSGQAENIKFVVRF